MEIEFNPSRVPRQGYTEWVARQGAPATAPRNIPARDTAPAPIEKQPAQPAEVRPEKVAHAKSLLANESYPPDYLMDRIAVLLAINIEES